MSSRGARQLGGAARGLALGLVLVAGAAGLAHGQAPPPAPTAAFETECVLELRDGTTIRAQVLEYLPGSHVMLRSFDGQTFRLPIDVVLDIRHPGEGPFPPSPACDRIARAVRSPTPPERPPPPEGPPRTPEPPTSPEDEPASRTKPLAPKPAADLMPQPLYTSGPLVTMDKVPPHLELEITDGVKQTQSYSRRRLVTRWEYQWKRFCAAPCGDHLGEEGIFRVTGAGVRPTAPFRLDVLGDGPFHLKLRMGPAGMYRSGIGSIVLGVLSSLGGAALLITGAVTGPTAPAAGTPTSYRTDYENALGSQRAMFTAGGLMIGTGIIGTVAGALLMRRGKSLVTVERPRRVVEPNPNPNIE